MDKVIIALGGSGTKIAKGVANLATLGLLSGSGDRLRFWVIDSEEKSPAFVDLNSSVESARLVQKQLGDGWLCPCDGALHLNPAKDPRRGNATDWVADSRFSADAHLLGLFFSDQDRRVALNGGFFRRAHLGHLFAEQTLGSTLNADETNGPTIRHLLNNLGAQARILVVGGEHGGTGAATRRTVLKVIEEQRTRDNEKKSWNVLSLVLGPVRQIPQVAEPDPVKAPDLTQDQIELEKALIRAGIVIRQGEALARTQKALFSYESCRGLASWVVLGANVEAASGELQYRSTHQNNPDEPPELAAATLGVSFLRGEVELDNGAVYAMNEPIVEKMPVKKRAAAASLAYREAPTWFPFDKPLKKWQPSTSVNSLLKAALPLDKTLSEKIVRDSLSEKIKECKPAVVAAAKYVLQFVSDTEKSRLASPPAGADWGAEPRASEDFAGWLQVLCAEVAKEKN